MNSSDAVLRMSRSALDRCLLYHTSALPQRYNIYIFVVGLFPLVAARCFSRSVKAYSGHFAVGEDFEARDCRASRAFHEAYVSQPSDFCT
jgi:hypothetical protein